MTASEALKYFEGAGLLFEPLRVADVKNDANQAHNVSLPRGDA